MRAFVVHWDLATLADKQRIAAAAGFDVVGAEPADGQRAYDEVRRLTPDAVLVWTTLKPSHGRVTAAAIRSASWGRKVPILFVDDASAPAPPATAKALRDAVPDAILDHEGRLGFWRGRIAALRAAILAPGSP